LRLRDYWLRQEFSSPYTPKQNGIVERWIRRQMFETPARCGQGLSLAADEVLSALAASATR
jgi:transposase InsO family protein